MQRTGLNYIGYVMLLAPGSVGDAQQPTHQEK